jgi:hypothetical protein
VFCLLAAPHQAWAGSPILLLDFGAGGGYDDNLNNASSADQREGSVFGSSWVTTGVSIPVSQKVRLAVSGAYTGTYYADFDDLTVNALAVRSSGRLLVRDSTSVDLAASAGRRWYGDDDRNATVYDASLGFRERVMPRLAVTAGYRYTSRAAESTFSSRTNRFAVGAEFELVKNGRIGLGYAVEVGQSPFYQAASVPIPSGGRGRRTSTTFGANQVAFRADTTIQTLSASWDRRAFESVAVRVEYAHSFIAADPGDAQSNVVWASVAYRY